MELIEEEWKKGSKSTWIEIIAAPTGHITKIDSTSDNDKSGNYELKFVRKNVSVLTGSQVRLLSKEMIKKFICYSPPPPSDGRDIQGYSIGSLLGIAEEQIPFTVNLEKLIHYHVGVFAFTGSGKSNLTSMIIRKSAKAIPNLKFVIFDISSEYGINILDLLKSTQSRIILSEPLIGNNTDELCKDYLRKHVCPESLEDAKQRILLSVAGNGRWEACLALSRRRR